MTKEAKPFGKWARCAKKLKDETQTLHGAHTNMLVAFESDSIGTARERLIARTQSAMAMLDACEKWLVAMDHVVKTAEREASP